MAVIQAVEIPGAVAVLYEERQFLRLFVRQCDYDFWHICDLLCVMGPGFYRVRPPRQCF
jgi:hypothetical protein